MMRYFHGALLSLFSRVFRIMVKSTASEWLLDDVSGDRSIVMGHDLYGYLNPDQGIDCRAGFFALDDYGLAC